MSKTPRSGRPFFPPLGPAKVSGGIAPRNWDRLVLGGIVCPALATITRGGIKLREDKKSKAGADGTNPCYHGIDPQALGVELETYSDDDREALASILSKFTPIQDREPQPVTINHPSVRHLNISKVVLTEVGPFLPVKPGVAKVHLSFSHWMPPKSPGKSASHTPVKAAITNKLLEEAKRRANQNPKPTAKPGFAGPPTGVK
jgi:hypothetical protein